MLRSKPSSLLYLVNQKRLQCKFGNSKLNLLTELQLHQSLQMSECARRTELERLQCIKVSFVNHISKIQNLVILDRTRAKKSIAETRIYPLLGQIISNSLTVSKQSVKTSSELQLRH